MKFLFSIIMSLLIINNAYAFPFNCPDDEKHDDEWTYLDCTHDPIDCEILAWQCEFDEYKYEYRGYPCGNRVYMRFACYGR